jgi:hypothetical protein
MIRINCKIISIIAVLFISLSIFEINSQNYNWITPNKPYLKLYVIDDGIYRISQNDFTQAGINTAVIDPRTVKVYYKGFEIPIYFEGEQDGTFDAGDFLDFYGKRNYGGITRTYLASFGPAVTDYFTDEYFDLYSDTSVYWIGWDGANGIRFTNSSYTVTNEYPLNYSYEKVHIETDSLYSLGVTLNPNIDFRYFNNEKISGEGWYWRNFTPQFGMSLARTFQLPLLNALPVSCTFRVFAYPNSRDTSINEHKLVLTINGNNITTLARDDYNRFDTSVTFSSSILNSGSNTVLVTYSPSFSNPNITPSLYFDLIEITYPKQMKLSAGYCRIISNLPDTSSALYKITGYNSVNPVYIYDVKNNIKTASFSTNGDTLFFTGKQNGSFEIHNQQITKKPFRVISKQVPNLVSNTNGADYIIIYNNLFESQAEQLRSFRQTRDNFRSIKASIEDVTDIFNYGIENPIAIKNFLRYVYNNWQQPRINYVLLMGRGSLDPKKNKVNSNFHRNLIPIYGNPPSDGYFVNFNNDGITYFHQISIGRMPVYTIQEAQDGVNKIISYETQHPQSWWKNFNMITGGPNRNEQIQFQTQSNELVNNYLIVPPISGNAEKIYRNDSAGFITFNYADSIKNAINRGGLLVNFIGHAASQDWELGLEDPFILNNGNKMPLVLSMTCFTGINADESFRSFGEKFINAPNRGAIGFIGSTGWSFSGAGYELNKNIFIALSQDTIRRLGTLIKAANNRMINDSISFQVRNMINSYNLLGDPACKLLLPSGPEFVIGQTDYRISNQYPIAGEQVRWTIFPKNYGLFASNCLIRFEILKNGLPFRFKDTNITNFKYYDTVSYTFTIDTIGNYSLRATLDYNNAYPNEDPTNNILTIPLPLRNISFTPLKPIDNSVITSDSAEFVCLNPQIDSRRNNIKVILQLDTNRNFINPLLNFSNINPNGVSTKIKHRLPMLDSNIVYYWRTNSIINNDSTGWSEIYKFVYNPAILSSNSKTALSDSLTVLYPKLLGQFNENSYSGLYYTGSGFKLNSQSGQLEVKSYGSNGSEASYFIINQFTIYADGGQNTGLNIVKVRKLTGSIAGFKNFRMSSPQSSDSVLNFLNTFDTTHYIMIGMASFVAVSDSLKQTAKNKIKQFGSMLIDSVTRFDQFDSYAFIGYLGAGSGDVSEQFHRFSSNFVWTPSFASKTPVFLSTHGTIDFSIGPAHRWKYFSWNRILAPGSSVNFDITGINNTGISVPLMTNISSNSLTNLDTLNSFQYPYLKLRAKLEIDTLTGLESPEFKSLYFKYTPPCEIIPDNYSFIRSDSSVNEGAIVTISVKTYNIGFVPAGTIVYSWKANVYNGIINLKTDTIYTPLLPESSYVSSVTFNTQGLKNPQLSIDTLNITFEAALLNEQNDYYPFNNYGFTNIAIIGDSTGPSIDVTYNGVRILNGDIIQAKPEIAFRFFDDSKLEYTLNDTSGIYIKLDGKKVNFSTGGVLNPEITFTAINEGSLKTLIIYKPELTAGMHLLQYFGQDKDNNRDTLVHNVYISYDFNVRNLYNYPNPTRGETHFTFDLFAPEPPQKCIIKIYTVTGRLIKEISSSGKVGFNAIYWDGKDSDGEHIANGIYLYKLILEGNSKTETAIQKLAVLK